MLILQETTIIYYNTTCCTPQMTRGSTRQRKMRTPFFAAGSCCCCFFLTRNALPKGMLRFTKRKTANVRSINQSNNQSIIHVSLETRDLNVLPTSFASPSVKSKKTKRTSERENGGVVRRHGTALRYV